MIASRKTDAEPGTPAKPPVEPGQPAPQATAPEIPRAVDVADGIPDRSARPARWVWVAIATVFLAWMAFLIYCAAAGRV